MCVSTEETVLSLELSAGGVKSVLTAQSVSLCVYVCLSVDDQVMI